MRILTIVGPTATGKTDLAIRVARRISGEIISADSRQIYKYLNIGTAKPSREQRRQIRFHLIDFIQPDEDYSCGQFARDATAKIEEIRLRDGIPIICGGTGLYIRSLFQPLHDLPRSDKETKNKLRTVLQEQGLESMYKKLQQIDPVWARKITSRDKQRILRGLEVFEITGKPLSDLIARKKRTVEFNPIYIGLTLTRTRLYEKIDQRFDMMLHRGLVREVKRLLARGYSPESSALGTIGYKEIADYLAGRCTMEQAVETAKRRTRNYAKRQITWFSRIPGLEWHDADRRVSIEGIIRKIK